MNSEKQPHELMAELDGKLFEIELTFATSAATQNVEEIISQCSVEHDRHFHRCTPTYKLVGTIQSLENFEGLLESSNDVANNSFIKTKDGVGEHLRRLCFPIVARIEEHVRAFLKRVLFYYLGHKWPETLLVRSELEGMETRRKKGKKSDTKARFDSLFDYMTFERLIDAMEHNISSRDPNDPITAEELLSLKDGEGSLADLKEKLREETRKKTVWDDYIVENLKSPEDWIKVKSMLKHKVCATRNAVMHHRAISRDAYEWLLKNTDTILNFFELDDSFPLAYGDPEDTDWVEPQRLDLPKALGLIQEIQTLSWVDLVKLFRSDSKFVGLSEIAINQSTFQEQSNAHRQFMMDDEEFDDLVGNGFGVVEEDE